MEPSSMHSSSRSSAHRSPLATLLVTLGVVAAVGGPLFGCGHHSHHKDHLRDIPEARRRQIPIVTAQVQQQLQQAEAAGVWNAESRQAFNERVSQLPQKEHLAHSLRLANLLNSGKVTLAPDAPSRDIPNCPCVPGMCPAARADLPPANPAAPQTQAGPRMPVSPPSTGPAAAPSMSATPQRPLNAPAR